MPHLELHLVEDPDHPASVEVYADGYVDGTPVRFLVDTGGATSTVPPGLGSPAASERVSHGAGGGQIQAGSVRVDEVTCGPFTAQDLVCGVTTTGPAILGVDILGRRPISIRLADAVIEVDPAPPAGPLMDLEAAPDGRPHWYVDVTFDAGVVARGILDTGASLTVLDRGFLERHPAAASLVGTLDSGTDASGATVPSELATLAGCTIGGVDFPPSAAVAVDLAGMNAHLAWPIDVILGVPLLRQAVWFVDPGRSLWSVSAVG